MNMIPMASLQFDEEEIAAAVEVMRSGRMARGPEANAFEEEFAAYCKATRAVATTNGTTALELAIRGLGIGPGDQVLTTPFSFFATAECIINAGAEPVFCDIDPVTFNLDPKKVEEMLDGMKSPKAIIPVHLYGQPADMDELTAIAESHGLFVIEDACQAHGALYKGRRTGSLGDAAGFSFYGTKNMGIGEGGIATFRDQGVARRAFEIHNHGSTERYVHEVVGSNYRIMDLVAAIARKRLKKLEGFNATRQRNAAFFLENISNPKVKLPKTAPGRTHVYHQFTLRIENPDGYNPLDRQRARDKLADLGVGSDIYYPTCINEQRARTLLGYKATNTPNAVRAARTVLSIPVHPALTQKDLERIVEGVNSL